MRQVHDPSPRRDQNIPLHRSNIPLLHILRKHALLIATPSTTPPYHRCNVLLTLPHSLSVPLSLTTTTIRPPRTTNRSRRRDRTHHRPPKDRPLPPQLLLPPQRFPQHPQRLPHRFPLLLILLLETLPARARRDLHMDGLHAARARTPARDRVAESLRREPRGDKTCI